MTLSHEEILPKDSCLAGIVSGGDWITYYLDLEAWPLDPQQSVEKLLDQPYPFLLESASGIPKIARHSLVGSDPYKTFWSKGDQIRLSEPEAEESVLAGDPFEVLREILGQRKTPRMPGLDGFHGGAVGFFGYEVKNRIEELPDTVDDDLDMPEMFWIFVDAFLQFDRVEGRVRAVVQIRYEGDLALSRRAAAGKLESFLQRFQDRQCARDPDFRFGEISSTHTIQTYSDMVLRAKEYIAAGDIFQANLSQRLRTDFEGNDFELYKVLTRINPSPFAFYFGFPEFQLVSCSPERLISLSNGFVQTRPIAGTRPRGRDVEEDLLLSKELILHPKERAEHIMIVDMARNDIGRVCEFGTVLPDELMVLEPYSHVIHIVTNIVGTMAGERDGLDLLKATFPGASITGVPKVRCMEIIDELESVRRGPYTGSAGWISSTGDLDLNIIIRTLLVRKGCATVHVGGGIVWDSDPKKEFEETLHKGRALLEALRKG